VVSLPPTDAVSRSLRGLALSPWDRNLADLAYWYRET
jgi:hypothetical protein